MGHSFGIATAFVLFGGALGVAATLDSTPGQAAPRPAVVVTAPVAPPSIATSSLRPSLAPVLREAAPAIVARVPAGCDRLVSPLTKTTAANMLGRCIT